MIIWGATGGSHDASLSVHNFGVRGLSYTKKPWPLWARLASEYSGMKGDNFISPDMEKDAIDLFGYPDKIFWYENPPLKSIRQLRAGQGFINNRPQKFSYATAPITYTLHHQSHAAYGYYTQENPECAVLVIDSIGEFDTISIWKGTKEWTLKKVYSQGYPHSLGLFYSAMTQRMGLIPQQDEYKIAEIRDTDKTKGGKLLEHMLDDIFELQNRKPFVKLKTNLHRGCRSWKEDDGFTKEQFASCTQYLFEAAIEHLSYHTQRLTGANDLAITGGCAMNKRSIDKIRKQWYNVHVPQYPGDPGSAIGAVLWHYRKPVSIDGVWGN